jgi:hypothetical protein
MFTVYLWLSKSHEEALVSGFLIVAGVLLKPCGCGFVYVVFVCLCTGQSLTKNDDTRRRINHLNTELNPICHLLILLEDLTFMSRCIVSIFQYISNKMRRYTIYLYLENILHVSGGTSTHHQKRMQLYLQHLVFVTPLLLSTAIVEELEPV